MLSRVSAVLVSFSLMLSVCSLQGCAGEQGGPELVTVTGLVTLDGSPLPNGMMDFVPTDGIGGTYAADIVDGKYRVRLSPGEKSISVNSYRISKTLVGPDGKPGTEQYLHSRYNAKTQLKIAVTVDRNMEYNIELTSK
ncbi:hypothetical protein SH661x_003011 [Planctomicrobium sp. SH661]|uniref:hypothetical protein n=1 Tax=Planctomicrobium sp. SH661 TaxID=3448124 RepID=UPI003F5BF184